MQRGTVRLDCKTVEVSSQVNDWRADRSVDLGTEVCLATALIALIDNATGKVVSAKSVSTVSKRA
jgi:hypothetical protein